MSDTLNDVVAYIQVNGERRYLSGVWPFNQVDELEITGDAIMGDRWNDDARKMFLAGVTGALLCAVMTSDEVVDFLNELRASGDVEADFRIRIGDFVIFRKHGFKFRFEDGNVVFNPAGLIDLSTMSMDELEDLAKDAEDGKIPRSVVEKLDAVYPEHEALQVCMDNLGARGVQEVSLLTFEMINHIMTTIYDRRDGV